MGRSLSASRQTTTAAIAAFVIMTCAKAEIAQTPTFKAYVEAQRCFFATSATGDTVSARISFDAAMKLGKMQGFTNRKLNQDFDKVREMEAKNVAREDSTYLAYMLRTCRALGLAR